MTARLFVYGTLRPGESNAYFLTQISGEWIEASLIGFHFPSGYGATEGYPVLVPSSSGLPISGFIFEAEFTTSQWQMLDDFETDAYQRILASVTTASGAYLDAYVYILNRKDLEKLKRSKLKE